VIQEVTSPLVFLKKEAQMIRMTEGVLTQQRFHQGGRFVSAVTVCESGVELLGHNREWKLPEQRRMQRATSAQLLLKGASTLRFGVEGGRDPKASFGNMRP
jgi:hypothetical protein